MARSLKTFSLDPSEEDFSEILLGDSINRKASSTERVMGRVFSTFGVETLLAGLEGITCSLTKYLKKERSVEIFLAIELFLFFRWRKLKYFRIAIRSTFSISTSPVGVRYIPELFKKSSNPSKSLR
jgi:hypothetical protein